MEDTRKTKNLIMATLCLIICLMSVAYAMLANDVVSKSKDKSNIKGPYWNIGILDITEKEKVGNAYSKTPPTNTTTNAFFHAHFVNPGDSITYTVTIKNAGLLDAKLNGIYYMTDYNPNIRYELIGIKVGEKLKVRDEKKVDIKITYNNNYPNIVKMSRDLTVVFDYVQDA